VPEQPDTERTDELAIRLARAHYARMRGELAPFQRLDDMSSGIAGIWRTMALTVQDVLGNEGVAHSMAAMDNLADATRRFSQRSLSSCATGPAGASCSPTWTEARTASA
jgi:hypothetical protein